MDRRRVAVHEAGHTLAAVSAGWTVNEVSIRTQGEMRGYCHASPVERSAEEVRAVVASRATAEPDHDALPVPGGIELYNAMYFALGGMAAEQVGLGAFSVEGAESDLRRAISLAERGLYADGTAEVSVMIERGLTVVQRRLRERWDAVLRVSAALERRGTLDGLTVRRLIAGEAEPRRFKVSSLIPRGYLRTTWFPSEIYA